MTLLREALNRSPFIARVVPFIIFVGLTALQGKLGPGSEYWVYSAKTVVGAILVWLMWPIVKEMRWAFSWEAVGIGVFVAVFWVALDPITPKFMKVEKLWNPHDFYGAGSAAAWGVIIFRILGSTIVVPHMEEVFYRSFLYRYIMKVDFLNVPLNQFDLRSFLITSILFGAAHGNQWLAGILCGFCYQWLVLRKNRLGDAMTAHAISNLLLGIYVAAKGQWQFW